MTNDTPKNRRANKSEEITEPLTKAREWQAQRLRLLITAMGWTLMGFEKIFGKAGGWASHILSGKSSLGVDEMGFLGSEYGVDVGRVFGLESNFPAIVARCTEAQLKVQEALQGYIQSNDHAALDAVNAAMQELKTIASELKKKRKSQ